MCHKQLNLMWIIGGYESPSLSHQHYNNMKRQHCALLYPCTDPLTDISDFISIPANFKHPTNHPYPGVTGRSLEGERSMAFYECDSTATTAVVQQHEWLLV